jgi:hypothetical protein
VKEKRKSKIISRSLHQLDQWFIHQSGEYKWMSSAVEKEAQQLVHSRAFRILHKCGIPT